VSSLLLFTYEKLSPTISLQTQSQIQQREGEECNKLSQNPYPDMGKTWTPKNTREKNYHDSDNAKAKTPKA